MTREEFLELLRERFPESTGRQRQEWLFALEQAYYRAVPGSVQTGATPEVYQTLADAVGGTGNPILVAEAQDLLPAEEEPRELTPEERTNERFLQFVLSAAEQGIIDLNEEVDAELSQLLQDTFFALNDDFEDSPLQGDFAAFSRQRFEQELATQIQERQQAAAQRLEDERMAGFQRIVFQAVNQLQDLGVSGAERLQAADSILTEIESRLLAGEDLNIDHAQAIVDESMQRFIQDFRAQEAEEAQQGRQAGDISRAEEQRAFAASGQQQRQFSPQAARRSQQEAEERALREANLAEDATGIPEAASFISNVSDRDFASYIANQSADLFARFQAEEQRKADELAARIEAGSGIGAGTGFYAPITFSQFLEREEEDLMGQFNEERRIDARTTARRRRQVASLTGRQREIG